MPNLGGRPKGALGGNAREARALLADKFPDWHPMVQMAEIAQDPENTPELRFQAAKEVNTYLLHKLKAIEITGAEGGPLRAVLSQGDVSL